MRYAVTTFLIVFGLFYATGDLTRPLADSAAPVAEADVTTIETPQPQKPRDEDWERKEEASLKEKRVTKPESGIHSWLQGDAEYDHALVLQKKLRQPILIDFSPSWCGPCQQLARNFFSRTDVMTRIDRDYIPVRTGEGPLSRQFRIKRYPTIAVVNLDGTFRTFQPTESNFFDELGRATK